MRGPPCYPRGLSDLPRPPPAVPTSAPEGPRAGPAPGFRRPSPPRHCGLGVFRITHPCCAPTIQAPGVSYQTLLLKTPLPGLEERVGTPPSLGRGSSQNPNGPPSPLHPQLLSAFPLPSKLEVGAQGGRASPHLLCNPAWVAHGLPETAGMLGSCYLSLLSLIPMETQWLPVGIQSPSPAP